MPIAYSLFVILAIFLSRFTWINFKSSFLSTDTSLVATESHTSHSRWNRLITKHLVDYWAKAYDYKSSNFPSRLGDAMFRSGSVT